MSLFELNAVIEPELLEIENAAYDYAEDALKTRAYKRSVENSSMYIFDKVADFLIDLDIWKRAVDIERADRYLGNGIC